MAFLFSSPTFNETNEMAMLTVMINGDTKAATDHRDILRDCVSCTRLERLNTNYSRISDKIDQL
jgi:hypothetical protein